MTKIRGSEQLSFAAIKLEFEASARKSEHILHKIKQVETSAQKSDRRLRKEMKLMFKRQKKELIDEMKVLIENLHHDLMGAKKDQVSLHHDHLRRHDEEILSIKTFVRMPA